MNSDFPSISATAATCLEDRPSLGRTDAKRSAPAPFAYPRHFLGNRFVYLTISPRARGLSVGVNLNPDANCNFECTYCEVDRTTSRSDAVLDSAVAGLELEKTLELVHTGALSARLPYASLPRDLLQLKHVALSGDGEPTTSPHFRDAVETVVHIRARGRFPFFKIVLMTNGFCLDAPEVQTGLGLLTARDEIWIKLDAGTQDYMRIVNGGTIPLQKILANILLVGRRGPVIIQTLFSSIDGFAPASAEIAAYAERLRELKSRGANISQVQIYSATRPTTTSRVEHLPLRTMSDIAATVRAVTGLRTEVF